MGCGVHGREAPEGRDICIPGVSQMVLVVQNLPTNEEHIRDHSSILGLGRSPGGGPGNPLQYSYLENPLDRGAWQVTKHRVAMSQTQQK